MPASAPSPLVETWRVNQELNLLLFDALSASDLDAAYSPTTRPARAQFAHVHNVRVYHVEKRAPAHVAALDGLGTFPRKARPSKKDLRQALVASAKAVEGLLADADAAGKLKGWNHGSPTSFLGYLLTHEGHHRGLVMVSLRAAGVKVPKEVSYGLWSGWNRKRS